MDNIDIYGYIRVSAREQNEDGQLIALREHGIAEKSINIRRQAGTKRRTDMKKAEPILSGRRKAPATTGFRV